LQFKFEDSKVEARRIVYSYIHIGWLSSAIAKLVEELYRILYTTVDVVLISAEPTDHA
jgi:hypothetical protein